MQLLRSILFVCLALLVLVSSVGVPVRQHFCGDKLMNWSVFKMAETCGMEEAAAVVKTNCDQHPETTLQEKSCCADKVVVAEADDFTASYAKLAAKKLDLKFVVAFTAVLSGLFSLSQPDFIVVPPYSPPLIARDIPVLVQSFLI